jgi:dihydrofolate synthase/folylpolyglutamate synthase
MSPHITEYRERITCNDAFFDESIYIAAGNELYAYTSALSAPNSDAYRALCAVSEDAAPEPTFFELLTLYYFLCARTAQCTALAVETGMGGRLDPTNIVHSRATILTGIEFEHTDMLGDTITKIAREKAGIIKEGCPVIVAEQPYSGAYLQFTKTAAEKHAPCYYFPETAVLSQLNVNREGSSWQLEFTADGFFSEPLELHIPLVGEVQALNTSLAVLAVKRAFPEISAAVVQNAVQRVLLPARFERISLKPLVVVDGAHTDISVRLCAETWQRLYGKGGVLIFGCAQGKDAAAMAHHLVSLFSKIIITTPGTYKVSEPEKVCEIFTESAAGTDTSVIFIKETAAGIQTALDIALADGLPVLGLGSFYLAAEIRSYLAS